MTQHLTTREAYIALAQGKKIRAVGCTDGHHVFMDEDGGLQCSDGLPVSLKPGALVEHSPSKALVILDGDACE